MMKIVFTHPCRSASARLNCATLLMTAVMELTRRRRIARGCITSGIPLRMRLDPTEYSPRNAKLHYWCTVQYTGCLELLEIAIPPLQ